MLFPSFAFFSKIVAFAYRNYRKNDAVIVEYDNTRYLQGVITSDSFIGLPRGQLDSILDKKKQKRQDTATKCN